MDGLAAGDVRTAARGGWLFERIVATGSLVLRRLGGTRAGEVAAQRYLASPYVTPQVIISGLSARTAQACAGRRIVAAQDTTEINFSGRDRPPRGLGPAGDGVAAGFFIHPVVAVDVESEAVLGLAHAEIWTRGPERTTSRHRRRVADKESGRWLVGAEAAARVLQAAREVVVVCDQEGDLYAHFARRPAAAQLLVRARHDRKLEGEGDARLFAVLARQPVLGTRTVRVAPRGPGDKGRLAQVAVRSARVRVARPAAGEACDPEALELGVVESLEIDPPGGVAPLHWRLATTLPVDDFDAAGQVIDLYRLRWRIEEVFRTLKRDGLKLEDSQAQDADRIFRIAALGLGAAVRILQLVDARDGGARPMSDVLDTDLLQPAAALGRSREGATDRQKNPHPQGSLAWLSWIVARYGGWNCYGKHPDQRPWRSAGKPSPQPSPATSSPSAKQIRESRSLMGREATP
jgi:hypothetical protein